MLLSPLRLTQGNIFYRNNCTRKIRIIVKRMTVSTTQTNKRGAFIVLEGCDRSGKSTQCSRLVSRLNENGIKAELARFPGFRVFHSNPFFFPPNPPSSVRMGI